MIYSRKLSQFKELIHGFTTKIEGDFSVKKFGQKMARAKFCPEEERMVLLEQVHSNKVKLVTDLQSEDKITKFSGFDGLITQKKDITIGVRTADCVPILYYEPVIKIIGAVHAGWQGTLLRIAQKMVQEINKLGGNSNNIVAAIGPHIGLCCYNISSERAKLFKREFGEDARGVSDFYDGPHLDLGFINILQLKEVGILNDNIDAPIYCTSCNRERFFSYRRSNKEGDKFGEMLAMIGMTN